MSQALKKTSYIQALSDQLAGTKGKWNFFHPRPTITLGLRAEISDLTKPKEELEAQGIEVLHTNRGGRVTYHGPGQIVGFPCGRLEDFGFSGRDVRGFVEHVFRALEGFARENGKPQAVAVLEGMRAGIWSDATPEAKKLASIGFKFSRERIEHGFAMNFSPEACKGFGLINACGCGVGIAGALSETALSPEGFEDMHSKIKCLFKQVDR